MNYKNLTFLFACVVLQMSYAVANNFEQELPLHTIIKSQDSVQQKKHNLKDALEQGANINAQDPSGKTALNLALFLNQDPAIVQFLIQDCNADVNIPDSFNVSPLHNAIKKFEISNIIMLLKAKANIELKDDSDQQTPLDLAGRSPEVMNLFYSIPTAGA